MIFNVNPASGGGGIEKIYDQTVGTAAMSVEFDLSDIEVDDYWRIELVFEGRSSVEQTDNKALSVRFFPKGITTEYVAARSFGANSAISDGGYIGMTELPASLTGAPSVSVLRFDIGEAGENGARILSGLVTGGMGFMSGIYPQTRYYAYYFTIWAQELKLPNLLVEKQNKDVNAIGVGTKLTVWGYRK